MNTPNSSFNNLNENKKPQFEILFPKSEAEQFIQEYLTSKPEIFEFYLDVNQLMSAEDLTLQQAYAKISGKQAIGPDYTNGLAALSYLINQIKRGYSLEEVKASFQLPESANTSNIPNSIKDYQKQAESAVQRVLSNDPQPQSKADIDPSMLPSSEIANDNDQDLSAEEFIIANQK